MKRLIQRLRTLLTSIGFVAALSACAGDDGDKLYPIGPPDSLCQGEAIGGCEEIDPEHCIRLGCELHRDGEESAPRCGGEKPPRCGAVNTPQLCVLIRGCGWAA